jgi:hypothetical protein
MGKKRHKNHSDKRESGGFVALLHAVIRSAEFASLSTFALKVLLDLLSQYKGDNNGDLCATWTIMKRRGWRSRDSLTKGMGELKAADFIVLTRQGGRHRASLYALTCYEIDWCNGKLDINTPTRKFMGAWRKLSIPALMPAGIAISLPRPKGESANDCPAGSVTTRKAA